MAAEIEQNIVIGVEGTGEAVQSLSSVGNAIGQVSHSFEHFGAHEASMGIAEFMGVTGNARPLVMAMTQSIMAAGGAMGLTAGAIAPVIGALAALGGIYALVTQNSEKHRETLNQEYDAYKKNLKVIEDYTAAGGKLSGQLKELADIQSAGSQKTIAAIQEQNEKELAHVEMLLRMGQNVDENAAKYKTLTNNIMANAAGYATWDEKTKAETASLTDQNKAIQDSQKFMDDLMDSINEDADKAAAAAAKAQERWMQENVKASLKFEESMDKMRHDQLDYQIELDKMSQKTELFGNVSKQVAGGVGNVFGEMFTQFAEKGQLTTQQIQDDFKKMAISIVADLIKVAVEEQIVAAMAPTGMFAGLGPSGVPGYANYAALGPSANFASGTDMLVDQPTPFVAGEAGMERVTVTPMGGSAPTGGGGGGASTAITVQVSAAGVVTDINAFADRIGQAVLQQVRGQQQQQFTRAS